MSKSVTKNYLYNMFYQVLILITPLITTPYVSRVLGARALGQYAYTQSVVTYLILIGTVGIAMYGERETAYIQGYGEDSRHKRTVVFWEINLLRFITVLAALAVFYFSFVSNSGYRMLYAIQMIDIVANMFDISWFFQGMEEFKKTVFRNMLVKLVCVISIFLFVRTEAHLNIYVLCYSLSLLLGNLSLWLYLPRYISGISFRELKLFQHLKPAFILFVPQIATQIYTVLDKTMLGKLATDMSQVGYYEQSQKIVKLLLTIITSLGVVMLPRMAHIYAQKDMKQINEYMDKSFRYTYMIAFPLMLGLISVSERFVPIFYGTGYEPIKSILVYISPIILFIGLSNVLGTQYQIPTHKQRDYTLSVVSGAVVNFLLNLLLIPELNADGAVIATVVAEFVVLFVHFYCVRKDIDIKNSLLCSKNYLFAGILMFVVSVAVSFLPVDNNLAVMCLQVAAGGIVYFGTLLLLKDKLLLLLLNKVRKA